ncbi:transposase [Streptomyces spinoverrucosus]|nr:transposase [Streptomyces spinoverrucosus]
MSSRRTTSSAPPVPTDQLSDFADSVFAHLNRVDQRRWGHAYLLGLLTTPGKKTVRRLAAAVTDSPTASQSLQQFVNSSPWEWEPARHELARWVDERLRPRAWTIATTVMPKRGDHSCGVHRRFIPRLGQTVNCQVGVGLFLSDGECAVPVDWRLHLPEHWTLPRLRSRARIPGDARPTPMCADVFDMVDSLRRGTGVAPLPLVADMRDGEAADLVRLLTRQRHDFVVAVPANFPVLPADAPGPDRPALTLLAQFAMDDTPAAGGDTGVLSSLVRLPGSGAPGLHGRRVLRLFTDWRAGRRRPAVVWITNMVRRRTTELLSLVEHHAGTADTVGELERDFGLLDFEGRSYPGWHHYMTLVSAAHAFRALEGSRPASAAEIPVCA